MLDAPRSPQRAPRSRGRGARARAAPLRQPVSTAGSETSQKANAAADQAIYQPVEYVNKGTRGPALVVIPGEIKSNNASFT